MSLELKMKVVEDNTKEVKQKYSNQNYNRFLRSIADDLVQEIKKWAKYYIYDTPESPNYKRTWRLYNTIGAKIRGDGQITITSGVKYAQMVHDGTKSVSPRPYMAQAIKSFEKIVEKKARVFFGEIRSR